MTEDEVETHIGIDGEDGLDVIHFQEYWIRLGAKVPVREVDVPRRGGGHGRSGRGRGDPRRRPGHPAAVQPHRVDRRDPVGPADRDRRTHDAAPVVGVSPIIGGAAVRGMADQLLTGLGIEISAGGVARHHGARRSGGVLDGWLVDTADAGELGAIEAAGISARAVPLYMTDAATTAQLARDTLDLADSLAAKA